MKRFSAQFVITGTGSVLKRAVISVDNNGSILDLEDTGGNLTESRSIEYHNGIIIPGFVNCHCHLELSHMKKLIPESAGLPGFIENIRARRSVDNEAIAQSASSADALMYDNGISLCADICNTAATLEIKKTSRIKYLNLIEVFGIDPGRAGKRIDEALLIATESLQKELEFQFVPHSAYSLSTPLLGKLKELSAQNYVTSLHFMESKGEKELLENHSGPLMESYLRSGLLTGRPLLPKSHYDAIIHHITPSGNLILVHNTFAGREIISALRQRKNLFWCLCPASNLYIEGKLPPVKLLMDEGCTIVTGTDSLASNSVLDILRELRILQENIPELRLEDLVQWSTINGAIALGKEDIFGSIEPGKKPGLLLIENADLINLKLTPETTVKRLV